MIKENMHNNSSIDENLLQACYDFDLKKLEELLALGANPNALKQIDDEYTREIYFESALMITSREWSSYNPEESVHAAESLLKAGADVQGCNIKHQDSPLHWAVDFNNTPLVKLLLDYGADINARDDSGYNPLHPFMGGYGAMPVSEELFNSLIKAGIDINAQDQNGQTPAHILVSYNKDFFGANNRIEFFKKLHELGADFEIKDILGNTVLMKIQNVSAFSEIVGEEIIEAHLKEAYGENYLDEKLVQACLDFELDFEIVKNALELGGNPSYLTKKQTHIYDLDLIYLKTPIELLAQNSFCHDKSRYLKLLLEHGADANGAGFMPLKPLHYAANHRDIESVKLLLDHNVDINSVTSEGDSALHLQTACWQSTQNLGMVEFLIEQGIDINIQNNLGQTAAHQFATCIEYDELMEQFGTSNKYHHLRSLTKLVEMGADITIPDMEGNTVQSLTQGYERYEHAIEEGLYLKALHEPIAAALQETNSALKVSDILATEEDAFSELFRSLNSGKTELPILHVDTNQQAYFDEYLTMAFNAPVSDPLY
jgi:ankyrin repeat protein